MSDVKMTRVKVSLKPLGDRVMVIPIEVDRGLGIVNLDGNELVKSERTVALDEWQQSEAVVFRHGTGVPKHLQRQAPKDTVVIIARHTASEHRIPIGPNIVTFLLVPSHGILMVKEETEVVDETPSDDELDTAGAESAEEIQ